MILANPIVQRSKAWIATLGPYQSLVVLAVPLIIVEPAKVFALCVIGAGHWLLGSGLLLGSYAASLLIVDRIFHVVKPKLLILRWFATLWAIWIQFREYAVSVMTKWRPRR